MQEIEIYSLKSLLDHIDSIDEVTLFRGHSSANWPLLPSIGRYDLEKEGYDDWLGLEEDLLVDFKACAIPHLAIVPANKVEWLIIAQHYGLPTRLLDWTPNPLKALFFAVENIAIKEDGCLWMFEPSAWDIGNEFPERVTSYEKFEAFTTFRPNHIHTRVSAQESWFSYFPLNSDNSPIPPLGASTEYERQTKSLTKFIIPKDAKATIILELRKFGITHLTIYPSLEGAAISVRRKMSFDW